MQVDEQGGDIPDRRSATGERRRYNRRSSGAEVSPPYYEVFERIATALEGIRLEMPRARVVLPPDAPARPVGPGSRR